MTRIFVVRHGQTEWNRDERFRGRADVPLNDTGIAQARATAARLAREQGVAAVYSSPLSRAYQTAAPIAERLGLDDWGFAYQSQGMTDDKWLGPTVESCLDRYAAEGVRDVVLAPAGFVCDHVEILYDVDIVFRRYAAARGIRLVRPESLNGSPRLTAALADIATKCLQ
jgi:ferrochelatase